MAEPTFKLPISSFDELCKVIMGYAHLGDKVNLDDLSKVVGMPRTRLSGNNAFLASTGIIAGGKTKTSTELGTRLGKALDLNMKEETTRAWREVIQGTEFLSNLVATARIKGSMDDDAFIGHILYASGNPNKSAPKTGARTTLELMLVSGVLQREENKKIVVATPDESSVDGPSTAENETAAGTESPPIAPVVRTDQVHATVLPTGLPAVSITIQLQLPETENAEIYENLFKALRKHLLSPDE
jgi:hypothetical protein